MHLICIAGGAILLIDEFLDDNNSNMSAQLYDMTLLPYGGRARSGAEFAQILQKSGFKDAKIVKTKDGCKFDAILAKKA